MKRCIPWPAFFLLSLAALGCSLPEPPQLVAISNPPIFKPKTAQDIKTVEEAMAAVITVCRNELGLPLVEPLYLHLYKTTDSFAAYGARYGRRPHDVVQMAVAVAEEGRFHINMEKTRGRPWSTLIKTLAHEYTHTVEYTLTFHRGPQWLREGFAEWVSAKVLDSLGWQDYAISLHRAKREVSRQKASLPSLSALNESTRWVTWANQPYGAILTYRLAFLAVNQLIENAGVSAMIKYFSSQDFQGSFGLSWNEFETEFNRNVVKANPVARTGLKAEKPQWDIGYRWRYMSKGPGNSATLTREVIREDSFRDIPSYVIKVGANENFYTKDVLGFVATMSRGKVVVQRTSPYQPLAWPVEVGKEWRNSFTLENLELKSSQMFDNLMVIANIEAVKVPAGTFEAFRIEVYGFQNGLLTAEYWYSPEVKWFVKQRIYLSEGVREEELISYKMD